MPLSTASLHVLRAPSADSRAAVAQAYRTLGFAPPTKNTVSAREAVLAQGDNFLSIYDSKCAHGDDGTLRDLAASLSAKWQTCALITTVQDSEDFEFLLYHLGRQVDSAVGDPDGHQGGLRAVRGAGQAEIWRAAFGTARFDSLPHRAGDDARDPVARFVGIAEAACRTDAKNAEDRLAAWCRLAQLPLRAAVRGFIDAAASPGNRRLALARRATRQEAAGQPRLSVYRCDDDYPYHRFFPAAWPIEAGADASFVWPILCRDRGLKNPRVALHIDQSGGFAIRHIGLAAHSAQHGRIMSATPVASFGQAVPLDVALRESDLAFDAHSFTLPDPQPGLHPEFILLFRIELHAPGSGEAMITPTLRAGAAHAPLLLPTLRLTAAGSGWTPIVSDPLDENPARRQAVLRLNAPAALTHVAILPDSGQDLRHAARGLFERWLLPMTDTDLVASIRVQKHPPTDASSAATSHTVAVANLLQGPLWPRLFDTARAVQSLQIEIGPAGAGHGMAGFSMQASLRDSNATPDPMLGREGATLALSLWAIADEAALGLVRLKMVAARAAFASWVRKAAPLQAWMADCTWIPTFDHYESYALTLYEAAAAVSWLERGLAGTLCDRAWPRRRLRFVAPHMWLGWELAGLVDTTSLTAIANVTAYEDGVEVELRRRRDLPRLERLLMPVLPLHL